MARCVRARVALILEVRSIMTRTPADALPQTSLLVKLGAIQRGVSLPDNGEFLSGLPGRRETKPG